MSTILAIEIADLNAGMYGSYQGPDREGRMTAMLAIPEGQLRSLGADCRLKFAQRRPLFRDRQQMGGSFDPQPVESGGMLGVASVGLVVNLIAMRVLSGATQDSLNMKGAYLEVWADMLGSLGVIGATIAIWLTGESWIDPIVAIGVALWVLPRTWTLLSDTTHILLQGVPRGFDLKAIRAAMGEVAGVTGVHDLQLWSVVGDDASLTAHVAVEDRGNAEAIRRALTEILEMRFAFHHATIQTETEPCGDEESLHK